MFPIDLRKKVTNLVYEEYFPPKDDLDIKRHVHEWPGVASLKPKGLL